MLDNPCVQLLDMVYYLHQGGDLNTGYMGVKMTVREFDDVATVKVDYTIYNRDKEIVSIFTRDLLQEIETYRRNMVKFEKYENARVIHVFSMNDILRVSAVIE